MIFPLIPSALWRRDKKHWNISSVPKVMGCTSLHLLLRSKRRERRRESEREGRRRESENVCERESKRARGVEGERNIYIELVKEGYGKEEEQIVPETLRDEDAAGKIRILGL